MAIEREQSSTSSLPDMLRVMIGEGATDLHLTTNSPPMMRIDGSLRPIPDEKSLSPKDTKKLSYSIMTDQQKAQFEDTLELDFSFSVKGLARFRANAYFQRGAVGLALRTIPWKIMSFEELGLPDVVKNLAERPRGLILVTGPTGSGKSTTLAAIIDKINRDRQGHIMTIEDPIEYLHQHKSCIVNQRELGADTQSFQASLRAILRQDPDVILVGEMRDPETIELALKCAETGHLTLSTLHTNSAISTINRIVDVFPPNQQSQIRAQLSFVLEGALSQQLIPRASGKGRVLGLEVLVPNPAIRNLIREDKIHQIYSSMQSGRGKTGMQTMNMSLLDNYLKNNITLEAAVNRSQNPEELRDMIRREEERSQLGADTGDRRRGRRAATDDDDEE